MIEIKTLTPQQVSLLAIETLLKNPADPAVVVYVLAPMFDPLYGEDEYGEDEL